MAGQLAGNDRLDPPLAGAGFVIPSRRHPLAFWYGCLFIPKLVSFIDDDHPRKKPTAPQDKMASSGQQYYELYRRSRYIALHRTLLNLHRSG